MNCKHLKQADSRSNFLTITPAYSNTLHPQFCKYCTTQQQKLLICLGLKRDPCGVTCCIDHVQQHIQQNNHQIYYKLWEQKCICIQCQIQSKITNFKGNLSKLEHKSLPPTNGLKNLGNTCYINSVIQCVRHIQAIQKFFLVPIDLKFHTSKKHAQHSHIFLYKFSQLIEKLRISRSPVNSEGFVQYFWKLTPQFQPRAQQDAQQFLHILLTYLQDGLGANKFIQEVFQGQLQYTISCTNCKQIHTRKEIFMDLSVNIPEGQQLKKSHSKSICMMSDDDLNYFQLQNQKWTSRFRSFIGSSSSQVSLYDCLQAYFKHETLDQQGFLFHCEKCNTSSPSWQQIQIVNPPNILVVAIKRFKYHYWGSKVTTHVQLPLTLDICEFCQEWMDRVLYELISVVQHRGGLSRGHYTAYVKQNNWYRYNDSKVQQCTQAEILNAEVYIAFYRRKLPERRRIKEGGDYFIPNEWIIKYQTLFEPGNLFLGQYFCEHENLKHNVQLDRFFGLNQEDFSVLRNEFRSDGFQIEKLKQCEICIKKAIDIECCVQNLKQQFNNGKRQWGVYYIISTYWMKKCKKFLQWKIGDDFPQQLPPVCNTVLFDGGLKPDLELYRDYQYVEQNTWNLIKNMFGCDVEIARMKNNIYSEQVVVQPEDMRNQLGGSSVSFLRIVNHYFFN